MTENKRDRRVRRTRNTLRDALMSMIVEQGYDGITVQQIADRANVARATFYLHFHDKDELLFESMRELYEELLESIPTVDLTQTPDLAGLDMGTSMDWAHIEENIAFYRVMFSSAGSMRFMVQAQNFLAEIMRRKILDPIVRHTGETPRIPIDLLAQYMAGAQIGLITWYLAQEETPSPDKIGEMGRAIAFNGLAGVLGLDK